MKRALIYTIIFAAIQFLTGGVATLAFELLNGDSKSATGLIVSTATASIVAVIIFLTARWTVVSSLDSDASLVCVVLVCDGCSWHFGSFYLVARADA